MSAVFSWRTLATSFYVLLCSMSATYAAPIPWKPDPITYVSNGKNLDVVLKEILFSQGFKLQISPTVRGKVEGEFKAPPREIFEVLAKAYGFVWYYDGAQIYISIGADIKSAIVSIAPLSSDHVLNVLKDMELMESRFSLKVSQNNLRVAGPSQYVNAVLQVVNNEKNAANARLIDQIQMPQQMRMRMFPLTHAVAKDISYDLYGQSVQVPGVATLLRELVAGTQATGRVATRITPISAIKGMRSRRQEEAHAGQDVVLASESTPLMEMHDQSPSDYQLLSPTIVADTRTNSVLVSDVEEMMPQYESIIGQLDVPQDLVQIDVAIIEISTSAAKNLGVTWGYNSGHAEFQSDTLYRTGSTQGLNLRINLLEKDGDARILSRPKIMTLNNSEAVVSSQQTFYAPVSGYQDADIFPIQAGLLLRVTPSVVSDEEARKIRLAIMIGDGRLLHREKALPETSQNFIGTQAVLLEDQSLLIGGYQFDSSQAGESGIPYLRNIPVLGGLFGNVSNRREQAERLFVITPRVITMKDLLSMSDKNTSPPRHDGHLSDSANQILRSIRANEPVSISGPHDGKGTPKYDGATSSTSKMTGEDERPVSPPDVPYPGAADLYSGS